MRVDPAVLMSSRKRKTHRRPLDSAWNTTKVTIAASRRFRANSKEAEEMELRGRKVTARLAISSAVRLRSTRRVPRTSPGEAVPNPRSVPKRVHRSSTMARFRGISKEVSLSVENSRISERVGMFFREGSPGSAQRIECKYMPGVGRRKARRRFGREFGERQEIDGSGRRDPYRKV
jgi:hypothetical protein